MFLLILILIVELALAVSASTSIASEPAEATVEPALTSIQAAAATTTPISTNSNVKGAAFNRFYQIWLSDTDYEATDTIATLQYGPLSLYDGFESANTVISR